MTRTRMHTATTMIQQTIMIAAGDHNLAFRSLPVSSKPRLGLDVPPPSAPGAGAGRRWSRFIPVERHGVLEFFTTYPP